MDGDVRRIFSVVLEMLIVIRKVGVRVAFEE